MRDLEQEGKKSLPLINIWKAVILMFLTLKDTVNESDWVSELLSFYLGQPNALLAMIWSEFFSKYM